MWARGNAGGEYFRLALAQRFGTGGSPSSSQFYTLLTTALTTSWQKFTATYTLPSISGKTLGTDDNSYFELEILGPINTTHQFDVAQAQVEIGNVPTDFEHRSFGEELTLCQRYYEKSYDQGTDPGAITTNGQSYIWVELLITSNSHGSGKDVIFKTVKRAVPTITMYSTTSGASGFIRKHTGTAVDGTATISGQGHNSFVWWYDYSSHGGGSNTASIFMTGQWTADAEL